MKLLLLLILALLNSVYAGARQIDETFSATLPTGWHINGIESMVTSGTLQIARVSQTGFAITPPVVSPSEIIIITNNTGTSNRGIRVFHGNGDNWTEFFSYTVTQRVETVNIPVIPLASLEGSFRIKIASTGSNAYRIDHIIIGNPATPSAEADFKTFNIQGQIGETIINPATGTIQVTLPTGSSVTAINPQFTTSTGASVVPGPGTIINLANFFEYVVTAQDGTVKRWKVNVLFRDSDEKYITTFILSAHQVGNATINRELGKINVNMPKGIDLSALIPVQVNYAPSASISPPVNTPRDFRAGVTYRVTAQDGSTRDWVVNTTVIDPALSAMDFSKPVGFASVTGNGFQGPTTGGGNIATSSNVLIINGNSDFEELVRHLHDRIRAYRNRAHFGRARFAPLVVIFEPGTYTGTGSLANTGSVWAPSTGMLSIEEQGDITFIGRGQVTLRFGFNVKRSWNIIFRNMSFYDYPDDAINIGGLETHHVWVDHCTFGHPLNLPANRDSPDGGVDVKDGASYVTISWNVFRNSWKTSLIGHSDSNEATDTGRLKTTLYMNHFVNTNSRHPRVRFGKVHVLNNLYEGVLNYGIAAAYKANVVAEGNFFLNTVWPMYADRTVSDFSAIYGNWLSQTGNRPATSLRQINNLFDDSGLGRVLTSSQINTNRLNPGNRSIVFDELNPGQAFNPALYYAFTPVDAALVPQLVRAFAGANKVDFFSGLTTSMARPPVLNPGQLLWPNPAKEYFNINVPSDGIVYIFCVAGNLVYKNTVNKGVNTITTRRANIHPGAYIVKTIIRDEISTQRVIVR